MKNSFVPKIQPVLLRKKDFAVLISVSVRTLDCLIAKGEIRTVRIGGCQRIARTELDRLQAQNVDQAEE